MNSKDCIIAAKGFAVIQFCIVLYYLGLDTIIDKEVVIMRRIEEHRSAWGDARTGHTAGQRQNRTSTYAAARRATACYAKAAGNRPADQKTPAGNRMDPRAYTSPEYQNDITARRYEMASWLQDMGTIEDTSMPDMAGDGSQTATWNQTAATEAEKVLTEQEQLEEAAETEEEQKKQEQVWVPDQEAEDELAGLKAMLDALKKNKTNAAQAKKRLPYRYQRISSAIRCAKNILQATTALTSAKSSLSQVRRQAASGKYSESEVSIATTHARKMVRTARTKLRHLKAENTQKNEGVRAKNDASQKMGITVKKSQHQEKMIKQQKKDREMLKLVKKIQNTETKFRNKHRRKENWDLMEADMEYLRRQIEYLKNQEKQENMEDRMDTATQAQSTETQATDTNMFTAGEQSVILEQEAVVETTVKESIS